MPGYRVHLIGGAVGFAMTLALMRSYISSVEQVAYWFVAAMLGALFPDVDIRSFGQRLFYIAGTGFMFWCLINHNYKMFKLVSFAMIFPAIAKHRGIFHDSLFVVFLPMLVAWGLSVTSNLGWSGVSGSVLFFSVGTLSHLLLDGCVVPKRLGG